MKTESYTITNVSVSESVSTHSRVVCKWPCVFERAPIILHDKCPIAFRMSRRRSASSVVPVCRSGPVNDSTYKNHYVPKPWCHWGDAMFMNKRLKTDRFSARRSSSSALRPVQSLMSSIQILLGRSRFLVPSTVPCRMMFARVSSALTTWPNYVRTF